jgi:hypothetical protein
VSSVGVRVDDIDLNRGNLYLGVGVLASKIE